VEVTRFGEEEDEFVFNGVGLVGRVWCVSDGVIRSGWPMEERLRLAGSGGDGGSL
jgi:hypothetical protein